MALTVVGLAVMLVASNVVWAYVKGQDDSRNDSLNSDLSELQHNYTSLQDSYGDIQSSNDWLRDRCTGLQSQYDYLQRWFDYNEQINNETLLEILMYENLRLESTVEDYYETVRDTNSMQTSDWWYSWLSTQDKVDFCADLAKHDIGNVDWPSIETAYYDYYGTYSYEDAECRLAFFLNYPADVHSNDSSAVKIEKILEAVHTYIRYRPDMNDRYNSPWETLAFRSGDCDDFSTLTSALFQLAGIDSAIEFVRNSSNEGHAMVLVHLDDLGSFGYYSYSDLTAYGLNEGRWIVIEPQTTIDKQNDSSWMSQWSIVAAADV